MSSIIGIDFGTTNSVMAVFDGSKPVVIPNAFGSLLTPSAVHFLDDGSVIVGERAKRSAVLDAPHTVLGIKRFMGRRFNEVFDLAEVLPFRVTVGAGNLAVVDIRGEQYPPQLVAAFVLKTMYQSAAEFLRQTAVKAVVTVPAYFNSAQREATRQAMTLAGFTVLRILAEPTAAVMAYSLKSRRDQTIVVCDLGGGTFDVTILETGEGIVEVKATAGDGLLGGDDFDALIVDWVLHGLRSKLGASLLDDLSARQVIWAAAVEAKEDLSASANTRVALPMFPPEEWPPLSRERFGQMTAELLERVERLCRRALSAAGLVAEDVDGVLLVGGATRIPGVRARVRQVFGTEPMVPLNADEAIAMGAAIQAGVLSGELKDQLLLDVYPWPISIETAGRKAICLIPRDTTIPTRKSEIFTVASPEQRSVEVNFLEGNAPQASDNRLITRLVLNSVNRTSSDDPQIEVTIDIDANATVRFSVKHLESGREERATVAASTGISEEEMDLLRAQLTSTKYR
jgi:molecular chaperone DnaK